MSDSTRLFKYVSIWYASNELDEVFNKLKENINKLYYIALHVVDKG